MHFPALVLLFHYTLIPSHFELLYAFLQNYFSLVTRCIVIRLEFYSCCVLVIILWTSVTRAYGRDFTMAVEMQKYKPAYYI